MDDPVGVGMFQGLTHLFGDLERDLYREPPLLLAGNQRCEVPAGHVLRNDVRLPTLA